MQFLRRLKNNKLLNGGIFSLNSLNGLYKNSCVILVTNLANTNQIENPRGFS